MGWREMPIGALQRQDLLPAALIDMNERGSRGGMLDLSHEVDVHRICSHLLEELASALIRAYGAYESNPGAEPGGGHRLVCALSTRPCLKDGAGSRLPGAWQRRSLTEIVGVETADDQQILSLGRHRRSHCWRACSPNRARTSSSVV